MRDRGTPAEIVDLLWEALSDMMGTAAAATLLRRALISARGRAPALEGFEVVRQGFAYRYVAPDGWNAPSNEARAAVTALFSALHPLLVDLTGSVVLRRLRTIPELAEYFTTATGGTR